MIGTDCVVLPDCDGGVHSRFPLRGENKVFEMKNEMNILPVAVVVCRPCVRRPVVPSRLHFTGLAIGLDVPLTGAVSVCQSRAAS